jgi:hypothetical protein
MTRRGSVCISFQIHKDKARFAKPHHYFLMTQLRLIR